MNRLETRHVVRDDRKPKPRSEIFVPPASPSEWTTSRVRARSPASLPTVGPHDEAILAILGAPLRAGEPTAIGFARKEHELAATFAALSIEDQRSLHARFVVPRATDVLATKLGQLAYDRRTRLIGFLADARRRAAFVAANR